MTTARARWVVALAATASAFALAACGRSERPGPAAAPAAGYAPVTVSDCFGRRTRFTAPPKRVLASDFVPLLLLQDLGLTDRVTALGFKARAGLVPAPFEARAATLPQIGSGVGPGKPFAPPSLERILTVDPDLVLMGLGTSLNPPGPSPKRLQKAGIPSYWAISGGCNRGPPLRDLEIVYRDLRNLAAVFGERERGERAVARMRRTIATVPPPSGPRPSVYVMSDQGRLAFTVGNRAIDNAVITLAGGRNTFGDRDTGYEQVGWEAVVRRDPDVIVVTTVPTGSPAADEAKRAILRRFLLSYKPIQGVAAVRHRRFVYLRLDELSFGGVVNARSVRVLADVLAALP